jgi:hypothetical protein
VRSVITLTGLLTLVSITGCQPGWVRLDGNRVDSVALQQARRNCQVDEKLAALEQDRANNSVKASKASSNEARMLQLDNFEDDSYPIYQAINDCMKNEGYGKS